MSDFFVHPSALVETGVIGPGSRIWAFAHVLKGAEIGADCNIGDHCFVEGHVKIGNHVVIKNGVSVWAGVTLEDYVFVGPNVVFTNDLRPRAKVFRPADIPTLIAEGASLGANCTIRCGLTIGRWAMVGAGSVVTRDVPDFALVYGTPASFRQWVCACGTPLGDSQNGRLTCSCGRSYLLGGNLLRPDGPLNPPALDENL